MSPIAKIKKERDDARTDADNLAEMLTMMIANYESEIEEEWSGTSSFAEKMRQTLAAKTTLKAYMEGRRK